MSESEKSTQEITVNKNGDIALFIVKDKINWDKARELDSKIGEVIKEGYYHIVFNLDDVTFLCSGGVGALVYHIRKVQSHGGDIYVVSDNDYVLYLFNTVCFDRVFSGKIFKNFSEFMSKVLEPKGLKLNSETSPTPS